MNKRIKLIRESKDLTQDEFGKRIGSARNTIANYETGNRTPSNAVIVSICKEFNVNENWL
ncbi:MAG: helix-turn-helix transcriptional regulator, partial [Lachnospiraceae bacterium]|nr:helix-turn-helix transcriptional regulator [Lachnospiraceae bacterium]